MLSHDSMHIVCENVSGVKGRFVYRFMRKTDIHFSLSKNGAIGRFETPEHVQVDEQVAKALAAGKEQTPELKAKVAEVPMWCAPS